MNQNLFHDQVSYSFLMPIFVVGSWDVIAPQEVLPAWDPPQPFINFYGVSDVKKIFFPRRVKAVGKELAVQSKGIAQKLRVATL